MASVQALSAELDSGQFTEALERWNGIQAATSPRTLARFGTSNAEAIRADLTLLKVLELNQRVARLELQPTGEAGFLWTSPKGAPFEVLAIAGLGALFALFLRRRALLRQGYKSLAAPLGIAFGYAAGPLLALGVWSYTRPNLEFEQYGWALVVIGFSCGFGLPYLARALAHLLGKDLNRDRRSARSSSRKARIVHAMKDLRPGSFAELKRAASQFAAELVTAEVEENPQS